MRSYLLRKLLKKIPLGDAEDINPKNNLKISCNIVFYKRLDLLHGIFTCLNSQNFTNFEIVLVEDKGITKETAQFIKKFPKLKVKHVSPEKNYGRMGYMRNYGLIFSEGEIIVFLDDDTIILDDNFLEKLACFFNNDNNLQAVVPLGSASYSILNDRNNYHDPYFFTNRCVAYRKSILKKLKGFDETFIGQEDSEFAIRFLAGDYKYVKTDELKYFHPPLFLNNLNKPIAVGTSFAKSKKYPILFKFFIFLNGIRWIPMLILPQPKYKNRGMFALGYAKGFIKGLFNNKNKIEYL